MKPLNLTGQRFGRLTAIEASNERDAQGIRWRCTCDCGKQIVVKGKALKCGNTTSCGCYQAEVRRQAGKNVKHGMYRSEEYGIWTSMRGRCLNPNDSSWKWYGAKGITVCERWSSFENFYADMGPRPAGKTLDRMDGRKGYSPENCRWATPLEQRHNRVDWENANA